MLEPRPWSKCALPAREAARRFPDALYSNQFGTILMIVRRRRNGHGRCLTSWQAVEKRRRRNKDKGTRRRLRRPQRKGRLGGWVVRCAGSPWALNRSSLPASRGGAVVGGREVRNGKTRRARRGEVMRPRRAFVFSGRGPCVAPPPSARAARCLPTVYPGR